MGRYKDLGDETKCVNFRFNVSVDRRLVKLMSVSESTSRSEVIRKALAVYECLLDAKTKECNTVVRFPDGTEKELLVI